MITSSDRYLNLDRALPDGDGSSAVAAAPEAETHDRVRTVAELLDLERRNILLALESTGWEVAGDDGAATLLGMNASTLNSRMRALKIERPR